jgi:hypothetical protein
MEKRPEASKYALKVQINGLWRPIVTTKSFIWGETGEIIDSIVEKLPDGWAFGGVLAKADVNFLTTEDPQRWTVLVVRYGSTILGPTPTIQGQGPTPKAAAEALLDQIERLSLASGG